MTQNYPKWPKITPKWPKYDARIYTLFPQFFLTEKAVPQTFLLLECMFWTSKGILGIAKPFVQYSSDKLCFESFEQRYIVGEFSAPIPPVVSLTCSPLFSALSPIWKRRFQMISDGNLLPNIMCAMKLRT